MNGEVVACDSDVQSARLGVDEAKILRGDLLREKEKGFCSKIVGTAASELLGASRLLTFLGILDGVPETT